MPSVTHLRAHQFTPERARIANAQSQPALRIFHAKRALAKAVDQTKSRRIPITGRDATRLLADFSARLERSESNSRETAKQVERLSRMPNRAEYRREKLARYLGADAVAHMTKPKASSSTSPKPTPIQSPSEPSMVEPCWDQSPGAKG